MEAKKILKAANDYKKKEPAECRYAYIQFLSMNGKEKFLDAYKRGYCKRCKVAICGVDKKDSHKMIGGKWPDVRIATEPTMINWANLGKSRLS